MRRKHEDPTEEAEKKVVERASGRRHSYRRHARGVKAGQAPQGRSLPLAPSKRKFHEPTKSAFVSRGLNSYAGIWRT
jgi:hypothetical protein